MAFGDDDLAPDSKGGLRCPACGTLAETTAYERRADASRLRERRTRRALVAVAIAVLALGSVALIVSLERAGRREAALRDTTAELRAKLEPARSAVDSFRGSGTVVCDDDDLRGSAGADRTPWLVGSMSGFGDGFFDWSRESSPLLRASTPEEAGAALDAVSRARLLVVLFARVETRQRWSGQLVVVDRQRARSLCWAQLDLDMSHVQGAIDDARLAAAASEALGTITKVLKLVR